MLLFCGPVMSCDRHGGGGMGGGPCAREGVDEAGGSAALDWSCAGGPAAGDAGAATCIRGDGADAVVVVVVVVVEVVVEVATVAAAVDDGATVRRGLAAGCGGLAAVGLPVTAQPRVDGEAGANPTHARPEPVAAAAGPGFAGAGEAGGDGGVSAALAAAMMRN